METSRDVKNIFPHPVSVKSVNSITGRTPQQKNVSHNQSAHQTTANSNI